MNKIYIYRKGKSKKLNSHTFIRLSKKKKAVKAEDKQGSTHIVTWGDNKIEISPHPKDLVITYDASINLPSHQVGRNMRRLAMILKKSHSPELRRLGYDILDEHYEEAAVK